MALFSNVGISRAPTSNSNRFSRSFGVFPRLIGPFPYFRAYSYPGPHQLAARHPQAGQRKELRRILLQVPVTHLHKPELAFDDPKRVLRLGPHTGFELFCLLQQRIGSLEHTFVSRITKGQRLLALQQGIGLSDVANVAGHAAHGVHSTRLGIDANVRFHAKVLLASIQS